MKKHAVARLDIADFHSRVQTGVRPRSAVDVLFRLAPDVIGADLDNRVVPFVFSDNSVDAYGDTIDAKGWQFDRSGAGTIALYGHDSSMVDNIIGRAHDVRIEGNKLLGNITFATGEENPNAERVFRLVKAGILNSVSVGFQPLEWTLAKDKSRPGGIDFKKQKLLEISVVGIPANENAVAQARAFGLDVEGIEFASVDAGAGNSNRHTLALRAGFLTPNECRVLDGLAPLPVVRTKSYLKRGLYSVSALAGILAELGWLEEGVEWEAEYEGDGSDIPQRLTDAMKTLGQILVDMTVEEVSELLADDEDIDGVVDDILVLDAPTPAQKALAALVKMAANPSGLRYIVESPRGLSPEAVSRVNDAVKKWRSGEVDVLVLDVGMSLSVVDVEKGVVSRLGTTLPLDTIVHDSAVEDITRAGKVLSSANETKIRDIHATMTGACESLQEMLNSIEPAETKDADDLAARLRDVEVLSVASN